MKKMLRRGSKLVIINFIRVIKSKAMTGAGLLLARVEGWTNSFKNYASRFVSCYGERNKQMTIKHNNLINRYYIKTVFIRWLFFYFFLYTHKVLVGNSQGKIYLKYLGIEGRIIKMDF